MSANESAAPARSEQTAAAGNNKHLTTDVVRDSGKTQETLIATVDSSGGAREVVSGEEWSRWCGGHLCRDHVSGAIFSCCSHSQDTGVKD